MARLKCKWVPTKFQEDILKSDESFFVIAGERQSGKTEALLAKIVLECKKTDFYEALFVSDRISHTGMALNRLIELAQSFSLKVKEISGSGLYPYVIFENNSKVEFSISLEKQRGKRFDFLCLDRQKRLDKKEKDILRFLQKTGESRVWSVVNY